jgi:hypothetical protein
MNPWLDAIVIAGVLGGIFLTGCTATSSSVG